MESAKVQMHAVKVETESDNFVMSAKVQMGTVKLEKQSAKVEMDTVKFENESAKVEMDSVKVEMDTGKEELFHKASFSDIETDETCWFQDSQVEDDDFNEQGLLTIFIIRVRQLFFIKYDVNSICIHAKVVYDIIQGFLGLPVDHLNQMDGQRCHLVQKQGYDYENAFSPTNVFLFFLWII